MFSRLYKFWKQSDQHLDAFAVGYLLPSISEKFSYVFHYFHSGRVTLALRECYQAFDLRQNRIYCTTIVHWEKRPLTSKYRCIVLNVSNVHWVEGMITKRTPAQAHEQISQKITLRLQVHRENFSPAWALKILFILSCLEFHHLFSLRKFASQRFDCN